MPSNEHMSATGREPTFKPYVYFMFLSFLHIHPMQSTRCELRAHRELRGLAAPGDVVIGGVFPLHYGLDAQKLSFVQLPPSTGCKK